MGSSNSEISDLNSETEQNSKNSDEISLGDFLDRILSSTGSPGPDLDEIMALADAETSLNGLLSCAGCFNPPNRGPIALGVPWSPAYRGSGMTPICFREKILQTGHRGGYVETMNKRRVDILEKAVQMQRERMFKNRESVAGSRAHELEDGEQKQLTGENEYLKRVVAWLVEKLAIAEEKLSVAERK